jgi:hypothetical protein
MSKTKAKGCLVAERKRPKKLNLRKYLQELRKTVVSQFQTSVFGLTEVDAEKCADKIMKVIEHNHKRAISAGLVEI